MGLFRKKNKMPSELDALKINQSISFLKEHYEWIRQTDSLDAFIMGSNQMKQDINKLFEYEKKYPKFFSHKPSYGWNIILQERKGVEKDFIDRYMLSIERKLLDYSTLRGKKNNFTKKVDLFRYYAGEFEPENVNYFERCLIERFPEYLQ